MHIILFSVDRHLRTFVQVSMRDGFIGRCDEDTTTTTGVYWLCIISKEFRRVPYLAVEDDGHMVRYQLTIVKYKIYNTG